MDRSVLMKDLFYWQIIELCNRGLIYKRIASMLTGYSYATIQRDCKKPKKVPQVLTHVQIQDKPRDSSGKWS